MKFILLFSTITFLSTSVFAQSNASFVKDFSKLFLGDSQPTKEVVLYTGKLEGGGKCFLKINNTRYGVYFSILDKEKNEILRSGVNNSEFTTQMLTVDREDEEGHLYISRLSVTDINERGEDVTQEEMTVKYVMNGGIADLKSLAIFHQKFVHEFAEDGSIVLAQPEGAAKDFVCYR
jgi:hypothetical protein